ncbi:MAG TPA: metalloregulator ArsR/SmtB family transcription factor [Fimbriimonadales bacterium]|jgi:DNA-binding transcriptional ArsR family regulator|nr:metalloregulator ArsR/SmtB family transcription factor [Fimbriimonadales bacterium]
MDQHRQIARMFKALGDPTRLSIFQFLRSYCCATVDDEGDVHAFEGPTISEVCGQVMGDKKITTSMSFHLKELRNAGLIHTEKRGKNVFCCVDRDALRALSDYLHENEEAASECC